MVRPARTFVPLAFAGALGLLVGCGDSDADSRLDRAADRLTELEDEADALGQVLVEPTTTVPPPVTQATAPPTTRDPNSRPSTTTSTSLAPAIAEASEEAILALVGTASWDPALPIPAACASNGSFTPSGEGGVNGGVISCTMAAPLFQVDEFFRFALTRAGFQFSARGDENGFTHTIADAASISGAASGDRTSVTIEQRFA